MAKMVKTAQGQVLDWDLLKLQTQANNNIADPVNIVDQVALAAKRQQRARMEAAQKMLTAQPTNNVETAPVSNKTKAKSNA